MPCRRSKSGSTAPRWKHATAATTASSPPAAYQRQRERQHAAACGSADDRLESAAFAGCAFSLPIGVPVSIRALLPSIGISALVAIALSAAFARGTEPEKLADQYVDAVKEINDDHAKKPGTNDEAALGKKLPKPAVQALDSLLAIKSDDVAAAL